MVSWFIPVGSDQTSALYEPASTDERALFLAAHGAGGNLNDRAMTAMAKAMRATGLGVVRFNFLYKERGSGRPDPMPKLQECFAAVAAHVRKELSPKHLIIGGRSMGGRAASMMAAEKFDATGLLLLAYPLHPPGQQDKLRDAHLPSIRMPVLCCNGTRDTFCEPDLMRAVLKRLGKNWTMHWLDSADHSFHVLKSSGRTDAQVLAEVGSATRTWLDRVLPSH